MSRIAALFRTAALLLPAIASYQPLHAAEPVEKPNIVVIFADDLGYGDLACFGHPTIATPHLDRMAGEGMKLTQFYSASPVCTPSRAALMTGRLPMRTGMCSDKRRVLFPNSKGGIQAKELTIAEALKQQGYATACVGKWHLGHLKQFLPTQHGFDQYLGIPYSNDMDRVNDAPRGKEAFWKPLVKYWNVPLMRNNEIIERPADQTTITKRYTQEAQTFITANKDKPFFLYMPHSMPHVPLFRSPEFVDVSLRGLYGDIIEEIDWSVGQVLQTLRDLKIDKRTLVVFTSDNGPWLVFDQQGGSAGLLREGKGSTWEGGMREPTLAWWPDTIPAGSVGRGIACTMDIFATACKLSGATVPADRAMDSYDLLPILKANGKSNREEMFFYRGYKLMAIRQGSWKMHVMTQPGYGQREPTVHETPLLFNLDHDPSEKYDIAEKHPEVIKELQAAIKQHVDAAQPAPSQLEL